MERIINITSCYLTKTGANCTGGNRDPANGRITNRNALLIHCGLDAQCGGFAGHRDVMTVADRFGTEFTQSTGDYPTDLLTQQKAYWAKDADPSDNPD